ncbi:hypothetical protein ACLQ3B_16835 [Micromonospora sp. DT53]|uniref:hypothetical protein n=1 Tax=Micromonospora sp. DT53 TaxID=3393444 RepID=UPI003CF9F39E
MAFRTWGRLLLTALGVSVLAGAGQLGVAYGFGVVRLTGAFTGTTVNQWPAQLVWVGWFAANAAVAGAVVTGRLARRDAPTASTGRQLAVAGAAALGATVIAPLCMQPARAAELISVDPVWAVGICAVVGAVIGAGGAIAVLFRPELGWNMAAVAGTVWLLALISVLPSLGTAGPLPTVRLGVLEPSWLDDDAAQRLALLLLPTVALLAGAATAGLARWRGQVPLVSGATGVAGPVLVAFAYLTAGPGDAVDRYQASPYYGSLIAILAGALGAAAAALLRWPANTRTTEPQAIEPTAILRPLPTGPALPSAATDRDTTERPDTETTNAELATAQPGGVVAGPWAAGDPNGVRTVPAHWDWPAATASGQHGPSPATPPSPAAPSAAAAPSSPAAPSSLAAPTPAADWLTAPTGEFTASGQTPPARRDDVPATTEPTTEPSASTDVSHVADATPTSTTAGRTDAATPTGGRADDEPAGSAATGTSGRPTGSGRTTRRSAALPTSMGAPGTGTANPDAPSARTPGTAAPLPTTGSTARTSAAVSTGSGPTATGTSPTGTGASIPPTAATGTAPSGAAMTGTGTTSAGTTSADTGSGTASTGTGSGTTSADTGSGTGTGATNAGTADHGTPEAPLTIKPRRTRKSKANPDATASDTAVDRSPVDSATTNGTTTNETAPGATVTREATTGLAATGTRPGRSAESTGSDAATDTPVASQGSLGDRSSLTSEVASAAVPGTAAAAHTTATGAKPAPATPVTDSKRAPATSASARAGTRQTPANPESPTTATDATQTPTTATGATHAPTTATSTTQAPAVPATATGHAGAEATATGHAGAEATASPRVLKADPGSEAAPADATSPTSDSAVTGARGTDGARPAAEDVPTAGLFGATAASDPDADRWTPAPSGWPVTSTWTVPPQASEPGATASEGSSVPGEPTGPTPRPRHRAPLPDLSRAGTWNAFDTSRRGRSAGSQDSATARTAPTESSATTAPAEHPGPTQFPGTVGAPSGATTTDATTSGATTNSATTNSAATNSAATNSAGTNSVAAAGTTMSSATTSGPTTDGAAGTGTGDVATTDATSAVPTPPEVAEQPSRRGRLGGLFRRNRSRADEESPNTSEAAEPLATQDEEFVDWVAGLSKPVSDNEPEQENGRRSLRSTGRHHRD